MRFFKKNNETSKKSCHHPTPAMSNNYTHEKVQESWKKCMNSNTRNMSRGAFNIFRSLKCRCAWGNKQLWGSREKGRGKPGHHKPK